MADAWSPAQYERFRAERAQPYWDLAALVEARPGMLVADLGCGTGELTAELHRKLQARETLGIDSSPAMLAKAPQGLGLRFEQQDISAFQPSEKLDLIFSNAALHWLPDHPALLRRLTGALAPGGQIAVQMPMTDDLITHQTASELARSPEFRRLITAKRNFIIPAVIFFLVYYFALPLGNGLAPSLMNTKVIGNINLAYLFALSEFVMAWILAAVYIRRANRVFDPLAAAVRRLAARMGLGS